MYRQTQGHHQESFRTGTAAGGTDWQALELQLNRTRTILQEILVHLQEVLRNLKMARTGGRGFSAASGGEAHARHDYRFRAQAATGQQQTSRSQGAGTASGATRNGHTATGGFHNKASNTGTGRSASAGSATSTGTAGSERFRSTWSRPGSGTETRTETGQNRNFRSTAGTEAGAEHTRFRTSATAGEKTRTNENRWSFRSSASSASRAQNASGESFRERQKTQQGTFRTATGTGATGNGSAGGKRETRAETGNTSAKAGSQRAQTSRGSASQKPSEGFCMDQARQSRAREMARRGGMNLKCAYDILCVDYPCSVDEIKIAYRYMARLYHPDLGGDEEAMKDVNVAYELAMRFCAGPRRASTAWAV